MKMTLAVDDVGRVVLPKPVRESLGINGRSRIQLEVFGGRAEISLAAEDTSEVHRTGGRLVSNAPLPEEWDSGDAVARMRNQRLRR